jgi:hypothetical protein
VHQVGHADQGRVGERVLGQGRDRGVPVDIGERLGEPAGGQDAGSAVEAGLGQVAEQGVGRGPAGRGRPDDGVADPHDQPAVGGTPDNGRGLPASA